MEAFLPSISVFKCTLFNFDTLAPVHRSGFDDGVDGGVDSAPCQV